MDCRSSKNHRRGGRWFFEDAWLVPGDKEKPDSGGSRCIGAIECVLIFLLTLCVAIVLEWDGTEELAIHRSPQLIGRLLDTVINCGDL